MSWYNIDGHVVELKGPDDLYAHDVLRIPNYPSQQDAQQHRYNVNPGQAAGLLPMAAIGGALGLQAELQSVAAGQPVAAQAQAGGAGGQALVSQGWKVVFGNWTGVLTRGLKIVFGGLLIVMGILQFSGRTQREALQVIGSKAGVL